MEEDNELDRQHESQSARQRHQRQNEVNWNELLVGSFKQRLSSHSGFSPKHRQHQQESHRSSDSTKSTARPECDRMHDVVDRLTCSRHAEEKSPEQHDADKLLLDLLDRASVYRDLDSNISAAESHEESERVNKNVSVSSPVHDSHHTLDDGKTATSGRTSKGVRFNLSTEDEHATEKKEENPSEEEVDCFTDRLQQLLGKRPKVAATSHVKFDVPDFTEQTRRRRIFSQRLGTTRLIVLAIGDRRDADSALSEENRVAVKPDTSAVTEQRENRSLYRESVFTSSTYGFSSYSRPISQDDRTEFSTVSSLKIYTSVISVGSNGKVVLTTRVTTHQPSHDAPSRRRRRPCQISVIQGLTGGLGIEVTSEPAGAAIITSIDKSGPVGQNENVR